MPKAILSILAVLVVAGCVASGNPAGAPKTAAFRAGTQKTNPWQVSVDPADRADMAAAEAEFIFAAERFEESGQHAMLSVMDLAVHGGVDAQRVKRPLGRWQEALGQFHAALERYRGSRSQADATELLRLIGVQQAVMEEIKDAIPETKAQLGG